MGYPETEHQAAAQVVQPPHVAGRNVTPDPGPQMHPGSNAPGTRHSEDTHSPVISGFLDSTSKQAPPQTPGGLEDVL